jgi:hypothetical protein
LNSNSPAGVSNVGNKTFYSKNQFMISKKIDAEL